MRMNERSLVLLIGAGLVAAIAVAVVLFLVIGGGDDEAGDAAETGGAFPLTGNAAESLEGGPDEMLYLSGTSLVRRNLEDGSEVPAGTINSPSVYPSTGSSWIAYVTARVGEEDFSAEPVLHLYDPESDEKKGYGLGVGPVWNRQGTHVAFLRPVEPRDCEGETCLGDVGIVVVEAATGEETSLLDSGRYSILGWAGDWILVSDFDDPSTIVTVSLDDERKVLGIPASQYWDSSPDGRWVVKVNAKKTEFLEMEDGELTDERVTVEIGEYRMLEGAWAHDSSQVAAVVSEQKRNGESAGTRIVTFSPEEPRPETVNETFGATGTVLWSVDNESVVFASLLDPKRALFQAKTCSLGNQTSCEIVTSWTEGVALLRAE